MIKYKRIMCDSSDELVKCAKYLISNGYEIENWDSKNEKYIDLSWGGFKFNKSQWKGLQKFGNNSWIRFIPTTDEHKENSINFKVLTRKEKLIKLDGIKRT